VSPTDSIDAAIHRDWVANVGRRSAYARIAHLFCEIWFRLPFYRLFPDWLLYPMTLLPTAAR
jgi:hypothetical protein